MAEQLVHLADAQWIPSHGKKPDWKAEGTLQGREPELRALNGRADEAASRVLEERRAKAEPRRKEVQQAKEQAEKALQCQGVMTTLLQQRAADTGPALPL